MNLLNFRPADVVEGRTTTNTKELIQEEGFARSIWAYDNHRRKRSFKASDDVQTLCLELQLGMPVNR